MSQDTDYRALSARMHYRAFAAQPGGEISVAFAQAGFAIESLVDRAEAAEARCARLEAEREHVAKELRALAGSKPGAAQAGFVTVAASDLEYLAALLLQEKPG